MKYMISLLAILLITLGTSCRKHSVKGEGSIISETRDLSAFDAVQADGDIDVEVYPSNINQVTVKGYGNLVGIFETNVYNGTLKLKFKDKYFNVRNNNIKVYVYTKNMSSYSINGSGNTTIKSGMTSENMKLDINGSGNINIDKNDFIKMNYKINGSGDINGSSCATDIAYLNISGSGNISLTVRKKLEVKISGSGDIDYWGNPESVDTDISGSGKVRKK